MAGVIVAAWELVPMLNSYLGLVALPSDTARYQLLSILAATLLGSLVWDRLCVALFAPQIFAAQVWPRRMAPRPTCYLLLTTYYLPPTTYRLPLARVMLTARFLLLDPTTTCSPLPLLTIDFSPPTSLPTNQVAEIAALRLGDFFGDKTPQRAGTLAHPYPSPHP